MKRYYLVASIFFYGIVTQTKADDLKKQTEIAVSTAQTKQTGKDSLALNIPDAITNSAQSSITEEMKDLPPPMAGAIEPSTINTAPQDILPSPITKGVIVSVPPEEAQKALDDSSAFVLSDGKRVVCFGDVNNVPRTGFVKPAKNGQPAQCNTLDPNTRQITPVNSFKIPISNAPFEWRLGSAINPDEWVTGTNGIPTVDHLNPVTGVCAQKDTQNNKPILVGSAVRGQGTQHRCVLPNGIYSLNHPYILVLAK